MLPKTFHYFYCLVKLSEEIQILLKGTEWFRIQKKDKRIKNFQKLFCYFLNEPLDF